MFGNHLEDFPQTGIGKFMTFAKFSKIGIEKYKYFPQTGIGKFMTFAKFPKIGIEK